MRAAAILYILTFNVYISGADYTATTRLLSAYICLQLQLQLLVAIVYVVRSTWENLENKNDFPNVIGTTDCKHIAVKAPKRY